MAPTPPVLRLPAGSIRPVPARKLRCLTGVCWATQAGDSRDHILRAGATWHPAPHGRVLVWALTDADLCVEAPSGPRWRWLGRLRAQLSGFGRATTGARASAA